MNEWKFQMRRRKRGVHCTTGPGYRDAAGVFHYGGRLCGCGVRQPPSKGKKTRIVKRTMARELARTVRAMRAMDSLEETDRG